MRISAAHLPPVSLLVAAGSIPSFVVPLWVKLTCALALTVGTALGGWRIVRTLGRGIYRIRPLRWRKWAATS